MKQQLFYMHGGEAYQTHEAFLEDLKNRPLRAPYGVVAKSWYQTLREDLGEGFEVFTPQMPNKQNSRYEEWKIWFERHFEFLKDDVILLGWSLGGIFFAKYLSENEVPFKVKSLLLLAAPFSSPGLKDVDCGDFILDPELVATLHDKVADITIVHSQDDFVVPYDHACIYKQLLPVSSLITYKDKNHFLVEEFPDLVTLIKEV